MPPCGAPVQRPPRIQVLPIETASGDTASAYLALAVADDLRDALASTRAVVLLTGSAARAGADYRVRGRLTRRGESVRVDLQLERPSSGQVAWTSSVSTLPRELPRATADLAAGTLEAAGVRARPVARPVAADPQLEDLIRRGRYQLQRRTAPTVTRAVALFTEAIAYDSTSALGWAGLARSYDQARIRGIRVGGLSEDSLLTLELRAAERAVELDPGSATAWLTRGVVGMAVQPTTRSNAIAAFRRALALDPGLVEAWRSLGSASEEIGDTATARDAFARAVALRPDEGEYLTWLALHYLWAHEYAVAARWVDSAVAMDPTLPVARGAAAQAAYYSGHLEEAEGHVAALVRLTGGAVDFGNGISVIVRLARGDSAGARATQQAMAAQFGPSAPMHALVGVGIGYLALGDSAAALAALGSYAVPGDLHYQLHLRREPGLDGLRGRPEFERLLRPLPGSAP